MSSRIACVCLVVALAGCGGSDSNQQSKPSSSTTPEDGTCVPFEAFPGYHTCLLTTPQDGTLGEGLPSLSSSAMSHGGTPDPLPASVDHRAAWLDGCVTPHDQGNCGWCVAHAATTLFEGLSCALTGQIASPSMPHLWFEGHGRRKFDAEDCERGWQVHPALSTLTGNFLVDESRWSYEQNVLSMNASRPSADDLEKYAMHRATQWVEISPKDPTAIKGALAAGHEVIMTVPVIDNLGWAGVGPSFINPPPNAPTCRCGPGCTDQNCLIGYHAIALTGYDDAQSGFQFLNSWSSVWADGGYAWLDYGYVQTYASSAAQILGIAAKPSAGVLLYGTRIFPPPDDSTPTAITLFDDIAFEVEPDVVPGEFFCTNEQSGTLLLDGPTPLTGQFRCDGIQDPDSIEDFHGVTDPGVFECGPGATARSVFFQGAEQLPGIGEWSVPIQAVYGECPAKNTSFGCIVINCATLNCMGPASVFGCGVYETFPGGCDDVGRIVNCGG